MGNDHINPYYPYGEWSWYVIEWSICNLDLTGFIWVQRYSPSQVWRIYTNVTNARVADKLVTEQTACHVPPTALSL